MKLAVVHDLAEALAGDIAPFQNVSKADKRKLEEEGLRNICATIGSEPIGEKSGGSGWLPLPTADCGIVLDSEQAQSMTFVYGYLRGRSCSL